MTDTLAPSPPASTALIVGAGPAGLTAAYELATRTAIRPVVLEAAPRVGGLSCTIEHAGNRIDIGGHRFFSKSDRVMRWWLDMLPLQQLDAAAAADAQAVLAYQGQQRDVDSLPADGPRPDPDATDRVMLLRQRKSRILHRGQFFDYPLRLSPATLYRLGLWRTAVVGASYLRAQLLPIRPEDSLEAFVINRFGRELYRTFFRDYTEKVWGRRCSEISADWGRQRIKGLSIGRAVLTAARRMLGWRGPVETSLIEQFLYPKLGPGQMWEVTADEVRARGGAVHLQTRVDRVLVEDGRVAGVEAVGPDGARQAHRADLVFSTMPVRELIGGLAGIDVPAPVAEVADGLCYRDFLTVGLLVDSLETGPLDDCWIYVQEPDVLVGRIQLYNNWSPYMVREDVRGRAAWIGLEYFLDETEPLWTGPDEDAIALAVRELVGLGLLRDGATPAEATVIRMRKAYPAYFGTYPRMDELRAFVDGIEGLYLIGRNGQHRYNNQDHSMLAAMVAVDGIAAGRPDRAAVWDVNTEQEYLETRAPE